MTARTGIPVIVRTDSGLNYIVSQGVQSGEGWQGYFFQGRTAWPAEIAATRGEALTAAAVHLPEDLQADAALLIAGADEVIVERLPGT